LVYGQKPKRGGHRNRDRTIERRRVTCTVAVVNGGHGVPGARRTVSTLPLTVASTNPLSEAAK
jgi:hypothetical protein